MLDIVGLEPDEEAIYEALVDGPPATVDELRQAIHASDGSLRQTLDALEAKGLVSRVPGGARYQPSPPDVALEVLLLQHEEKLKRARLHVEQLTARFHRAAASRDPAELVEVASGHTAVLQRFEQLQRSARREVRAIDKPPYAAARGHHNPVEAELLQRGIKYRVIYESAGLAEFHDLDSDLQVSARLGEEARVLSSLPTKLLLADDRLGLLPLQAAPSSIESVVVVHPSALLEALVALFESLWERALPLQLSGAKAQDPSRPTEDEIRLITLLTTGIPDTAMAKQLGLSYRTLQRRLRNLMTRLGAGTRFQAGLRAALLGWVDPDRSDTSQPGD